MFRVELGGKEFPCVCEGVNSLRPGDAYMRHLAGSSLVHVMACRLFGAKPLPEPMTTYCQLDPLEQSSVIFFIEIKIFSLTNLYLKVSSDKVVAILTRPQCVLRTGIVIKMVRPVSWFIELAFCQGCSRCHTEKVSNGRLFKNIKSIMQSSLQPTKTHSPGVVLYEGQ